MTDLVLLVEIETEPGQLEAFLARVGRHRETVLAEEPGCRRFEVLRPQEDGNRVFLYEVYADQAALEAHMDTPHMQQYREHTTPMIAKRTRTLCELGAG